MPDFDQEREDELAQLLREVRELRQAVDDLKALHLPAGTDYNVAVRIGPPIDEGYPVTMRPATDIAGVAYNVAARSTPTFDTSPITDE